MTARVEAAGGLVVQDGRLAVVHRPRYDDWTLPKGKLDPGETFEQAAVREVLEETGLECRITGEAGQASYEDNRGRPKIVRYFRMEVLGGAFAVNDEVDELRWLSPDEARAVLTYERDRELITG